LYFFETAFCTYFLSCFHALHAYVSVGDDPLIAAKSPHEIAEMQNETYTINFNNISMLEFLRFASKVTNLNFIFEDVDMQFTVSLISEEPVTAKNVMAAMAQVLRIHDLILLEQDGNVILTKSTRVHQVPPIISSEHPEAPPPNTLLVTRVFRIKNANITSIANIIRSMMSDTALIEVSAETRQLIITDIATNVEQIASLLLSLDSPHSPLDIDTYVVKAVALNDLIALTQQILAPFTEGHPLIFVPQSDTNSIYIVSTPHLIERALTVMEDLDIPPKETMQGPQAKRSVYVYKVQNRTLKDITAELFEIVAQMKEQRVKHPALQQAIEGVEQAEDTNSLIFLASAEITTQLKDILTSLDSTTTSKTTYLIYKILRAPEEQIATSLKQLRDYLKASSRPDVDLIKAIEGMHYDKDVNCLVFIGTPFAIDKLKDILPTFDVIPIKGIKSTFLIYTPQGRSGEDLYSYIQDTYKNLKDSGLVNESFLQTLASVKWVASTNALLFTGDAQSLERILVILKQIDTPSLQTRVTEVFIYKPQFASAEQIQKGLQGLIPSLQKSNTFADQSLIKAIQELHWNPDSQSFTVTADTSTIERLKSLIASFDSSPTANPMAQGFFLYKLQNAQGDLVMQELKQLAEKIPSTSLQSQNLISAIQKIEWVRSRNALVLSGTADAIEQLKVLIADLDVPGTGAQAFYFYKSQYLPAEEILIVLQDLATDMKAGGLSDPALFETIASGRYVKTTNSVLFTGTQDSLDKVKNLIGTIDISSAVPTIQTVGNVTFLLYKLHTAQPEQFMASLKTFSAELQKSNPSDQALAQAVDSMKYIKENNSVLFTGKEEALKRLETITSQFDVPSKTPIPVARNAATFAIYTPKYVTGEELIGILCDFMNNLINSGVSNPELFDTINNLKWIPKTSSLLISGSQSSIAQVQELVQKFDMPGAEGLPAIETIENTSFLVYKLQYHSGVDIQSALKSIATNLMKTANPNASLADAIESLQWIEPTNSLIATGQQDVLVKLKELIQNIDIPLRQVFIEVLVIETALANIQNFGLQWGSQFQYFNKMVMQTGNFPVSAASGAQGGFPSLANALRPINMTSTPINTSIPFSTGFDLGVIGDIIMHKGRSFISLGSLLNALQADIDSTIVTNQKIITQDNRQSTIFVGNNIPYTGSLVTNITANTTNTANIEYRDVGVNLTITPILGENDIITLEIIEDLSSVVGGVGSLSTTTLTGITTNHSHMETRVSVPDNKFLILSGVIQDTKAHFRTAIPCLGSLPVVGLLFSENDRTNSKANVIIFIRPVIIRSFEQYKQLTEHQEWLYKDQARLPMLKEEFDEGLNIVKTPEDE
jgi:type II secretory pathway component GspD/PulD (secretin)